jgi:hypothetical protein
MKISRTSFILLLAIAAWATIGTAYAQVLIGSSGAGWQTWNLATDVDGNYIDLNSNGAPFWDVPFLTFNVSNSTGGYGGTPAAKSVGYCLTSTGDCQGVGSALFAPGTLPFWGMSYNSVTDIGGAMDPKVYFRSSVFGQSFQATLYLNSATNTFEINDFGWFETNSSGAVIGTKHVLFHGTGFPPNSAAPLSTPDPIGKVVNFTPTQYFGFYYQDVSDEEDNNGPPHGCYAYTIFTLNDEDCTAAGTTVTNPPGSPGQGDHVFAIFLQQVPNRAPIYWVAGQDPSMCSEDGDCNLTIVKVRRLPISD